MNVSRPWFFFPFFLYVQVKFLYSFSTCCHKRVVNHLDNEKYKSINKSVVEAFYFADAKSRTYQRTNQDRWIKQTNFNNKKHGGTKLDNLAKLPQQTPPLTRHYPHTRSHKNIHFLSLKITHSYKITIKTSKSTIINR